MSVYLYQVARFAFRRRRWVLCAWLAVLIAVIGLGVTSGGKTNDELTIPGTESQQATDVLQATVPAFSGGQTQIVFSVQGTQKITQSAYQSAIEASLSKLKPVSQVATVGDPFQTKSVSPDGRVALGTVQYTAQPPDVTDATLDALQNAMAPARQAGVTVNYSGSVYPGWRVEISELPELIGLVIALIVLLISLGAIVAAGLPILGGVIGVIIVTTGLTGLAALISVASASTTVATMLGLSCGIDYGLFILSRYRNHLLNGVKPEEAVGLSVGTAGGSVVFAALTVMIALCGLSVAGIPFLTTMGLAAAGSVLVALLVAITLLPALLGLAGPRITRFINTPLRPGHHARVANISAAQPELTFGSRWARFVVRNRIPVLVLGVAALVVIALPATRIELGLPSGASKPTSDTSRQAYDITTASFGPGFNGPLLVVVENAAGQADVQTIATALAKVPDVVSAAPLAYEHQTGVVRAFPASGPNDTKTADLVRYIRDNRASIEGSTGTNILVGGTTASNIDVSDKLSAALPLFLIAVVGLAFVLLTFAFRTILVPIKSILGFLLSVAAAFGAEVAMFQWGWGRHLFGITPSETISFLPLIALAIIFGLSSDYEVFVVSRIKEEFTRGDGDASAAVERGTGLSARVVTSAALIMFFIFASFIFTKDPTTKAIGFCFAVGVLLDAFVVRLTLVPAVMAIAKGRFWYHPQWFAKYVPDPDIEGERLAERVTEATRESSGSVTG